MYKDTLQPGFMYHVYNRGNNKESIFKEKRNYNYFLGLWTKHISPVADTYCYSLQPNHFHFLVQIKENTIRKSIDQSFSNCFNAYAKSINKSYNRTGSLFQERFSRKLVDTDNYYTQIVFYIHSNSQKHRLTTDFRAYSHSSYQSIISSKPTLLLRNEVLDWFGGRQAFISFHENNQEIFIEYLKALDKLNL